MTSESGHYRWNVNPTWEHFCGLVREIAAAKEARSDVHKQHHLRAALYFGVGSIEAFLNEQMRLKLQRDGASEEQIFATLRKTRWSDKLKKWPSGLSGVPVAVPENVIASVEDFSELRGEITHPKSKDHTVYLELDRVMLAPDAVRLTIAEYIVRTLTALGKPYPFYLHGRVFIGMNGSAHWPIVETHNQQFMMALRHIGFNVPHALVDEMEEWERACMSTWEGFQQGETALAVAPCQPRDPMFPFMPRLCRRWWDDVHVEKCGEERSYPLPHFG
jgi:hypothetical protein